MRTTIWAKWIGWALVLIAALAMGGCNNKKYMAWHPHPKHRCSKEYDQHLVVKNKIIFNKQAYKLGDAAELLYYDAESVVRLKPNLNILGGRPLLWLHNYYDTIQYKVRERCVKGALQVDTLQKKIYTRDSVFRYQPTQGDTEWVLQDQKKNKAKFRRWMMLKVGESPTYYDTSAVHRTTKSMTNILRQRGYPSATVRDTVIFNKHKATCYYYVTTGSPILIDTVIFESKDTVIQELLNAKAKESHLKPDKNSAPLRLDKALFELEKSRITQVIRNAGHEKFSWNYINFEADTVNARRYDPKKDRSPHYKEQGETRAKIYVEVLPFSDTLASHPIYSIGDVYILPDLVQLKPHQMRKVRYDTTFVVQRENGKRDFVTTWESVGATDEILQIILRKRMKKVDENGKKIRNQRSNVIVKNEFLSDAVAIRKGDRYEYDAMRRTVASLSAMDVFKFPSVEYVPALSQDPHVLDCWIKMKPAKKQVFGWDLEANNYNASIGTAMSVSYRNRNIFKGAESFSINAEAGVNFLLNPDSAKVADYKKNGGLIPWLNLLDVSAEATLHIPRFLFFHRYSRILQNTHTNVSLGYRYLQQSSDFRVSTFYGKFTYQFNLQQKGNIHQFAFSPALLNFSLKPILADKFQERLEASNLALLQSLKEQVFIPSMDFSYTWTSPASNKGATWFFKFYTEMAGNVWWAVDAIVLPKQEMNLLGTTYSQFFKADIDARNSLYLSKKHSLVSRIMVGLVVPYGNSSSVPFSRRFFLGGPNSMRAWRTRYLGPGRQTPTEGAAFQMGDLRLEMNLEYRFKFNSWVAGAIFVDAGNIWLWKPKEDIDTDPDFPAATPETGVFTADFWKEIAMGAGVGLRLDFSFFIIRFDFAMQVHNPAGYSLLSNGKLEYWNYNPFAKGRQNWVLGVGYPF